MKKIGDWKLSVKLITGGLLAVLVPLLIVGVISVRTASQAIVEGGRERALQVAKDLAEMTELFLEEELKFAKEMAFSPMVRAAARAVEDKGLENAMDSIQEADQYLKGAYKEVGQDYELFIMADSKGNTISSNTAGGLRAKKINIKDRDYFIAAREGRSVIGKPIASRASGLPVVVVSIPLKTESGKFAGLFGTVLKLDALSEKITSIKIGETGYPFVMGADGIIIAHPKKEFIFKLDLKTLKGMEEIVRRMLGKETGVEQYLFKGVDKVAGFAHIPASGWSVAVTQNMAEFMSSIRKMEMYNAVVGVIAMFVVAVALFFGSRTITGPINAAVSGLKDISEGEGDLTKRLKVASKDEVGVLSGAFNTFIAKLQEMIRDITDGVDTLSSSATELSAISEQMTAGAGDTSDKAGTVAAAAEEMTSNMNSVSAAMEQSSANLNSVAASADEMNATINEIARNAEKARGISDNAVAKVEESTDKMSQLGQAAQAIGKVVETITDISEQVNLLSLNATIEAARAGDAGKGFAVVANEIKDLANQTSEASMDIKAKIENIQESSSGTMRGINEISEVITEVNDIVATIATAVEEQSAATREIAQNIGQASMGIEEVNQNVNQSSAVAGEITRDITGVNESATDMADRSGEVNSSSDDLAKLASRLDEMVGRFKI